VSSVILKMTNITRKQFLYHPIARAVRVSCAGSAA
jgi:hypothetical protein